MLKYVAKVPMRVSFFGGGTDVAPYCNECGGEVLYSTINKYAYCMIKPILESDIILLGEANEVYNNSDETFVGEYGIVKAVLHEIEIKRGCNITIYSDVPKGTGLGGSSAQIAAIILACYHWNNKNITKRELVQWTYHIEHKVMKINCGYQDAIATIYGGIGYIKVRDINEYIVEPLKLSRTVLLKLRNSLILYYTGMQHDSTKIIMDYIKMQKEHKVQLNKALDHLKLLARKARICLEYGKMDEFGNMLHCSWEYKKTISKQVTNDYINVLYENVRNLGALGGKILGAGGGGYLLICLEPNTQINIIEMLSKECGLIEEYWNFDFGGARVEECI